MLIKRKLIFSALFVFVSAMFCTNATWAQESVSFQNRLKSILGQFSNVRFSSISYYEINDRQVRDLKPIIKAKLDMESDDIAAEENANNQNEMDSAYAQRMDSLTNAIRSLGARVRTEQDVVRAFNGEMEGYEHLEDFNANRQEIHAAWLAARPQQTAKTDIYKMFLITTQPDGTDEVPEIIALVLCTQDIRKDEYEAYLISYYNQVLGNSLSNERNVLTYPELHNFIIADSDDETKTTNLYDKLIVEFRQGNCMPITSEVRGIGTELQFMKTYGKTKSFVSNENDIQNPDVQSFIRISDGQPFDYMKQNELVVSPDYISYRHYTIEYAYDEEGNLARDEAGNLIPITPYSNYNLPQYGVEIKYGLDEINYPSFFSEKMMIRAVWDNIRLGLILPTSGWSSLTKDVFNIDRRMTYAGVGISGAADFPIKVIPQSGVFSVGGSYVFGDAVQPSYKDQFRNEFYNSASTEEIKNLFDNYATDNLNYNDYLIRYTGQVHYTFGFAIDETYFLRFGIGGTIYGAEHWRDYMIDETLIDEGSNNIRYEKASNETIGGISLKMDFMSRDIATPFGATVQYFDEALYGNVWLQIPIVSNTFYAKIDVKGYVAAFKDILHPWESQSIFMPSLRFVFNF